MTTTLSADFGAPAARAIVDRLVKERRLIPYEIDGHHYIVTAGDHGRHVDIAAAAQRRSNSWTARVDEALLCATLAEAGLTPDARQGDAIRMAITQPISIVHGGAGTGKSTVAVGVARYLARAEPGRQIVTAFSARIAEKSGTRCGLPFETCHTLTGTRPNEEWSEGDPLDADLTTIYVDEAFSVGPGILSRILRLAPDSTRLVFLGDPGQLPPIEGGRPLHDLLAIGALADVALETSHRLKGSDHLAAQVARVNRGQPPIAGPNLRIRLCDAPGETGDLQKTLAATRVYARAAAEGRRCIVLTPTRHGGAGHAAISARISGRPSPGPGDDVIAIAAHPDRQWRNGESGRLRATDTGVVLDFPDGRRVAVTLPDPRLAFACAMSAHRAQGLEYDDVVVVLARSTSRNASRQLLASAMTRAPRCTIIADRGVLTEVCARDDVATRPSIIRAIEKASP